jgi:hypothetical protein
MLQDDEGPQDWEIKEEMPPERLQKKWAREEVAGPGRVRCGVCEKETPAENLTCIFCGADLNFENGGTAISQGGCPLRCLLSWVKRLFGKG